jgi:hypothetical protein
VGDFAMRFERKQRILLLLAISALIGLWVTTLFIQAAEAGEVQEEVVKVLAESSQGILLEITVPEFEVELWDIDGEPCQVLQLPGFGSIGESGSPALPVKGAMVGIPPGVEIAATVVKSDWSTNSDRYNLCPVAQPVAETGLEGGIHYGGQILSRDETVYQDDRFIPQSPFEVASTGFLRSQRVAVLRFQPFQYNPVTGELRIARRMRVQLDFVGAHAASVVSATRGVDEGDFETTLRQSLLNYDTARLWRTQPVSVSASADRSPTGNAPAYKILVDQDGIYQVGYHDLRAVGVPVDNLDPRKIHLRHLGQEVDIYLHGQFDGDFSPGDYILFYGQGIDSKYTDENVYWLTWGGANGARMAEVNGIPDGSGTIPTSFQTRVHLEEDHIYQNSRPSGEEHDHWYWEGVRAPASKEFQVDLVNLATEPVSITVRGSLRSHSASPQHHTKVYLNGHLIDEATWPEGSEYTFEVTVPQAHLVEGSNTLKVEAPKGAGSNSQVVFVNWFEIDYYDTFMAEDDLLFFDGDTPGTSEFRVSGFTSIDIEVFDISTPKEPKMIECLVIPDGATYRLRLQQTIPEERHYLASTSGSWLSPLDIRADERDDLQVSTNGADYIIITHKDFYTEMLSLAAYRTSQGYRTRIVDVEDVYDAFSGGIFDPNAIHDFLAYAYANWEPPAPAYVLLVGDGHYDYKDNFESGEPIFIPPYLAEVDPWLGETAADNRYVTVSGEDFLPDMHLGRLPVRTPQEANALVDKILDYEFNLPVDDWNENVLFIADDPDKGGDFGDLLDMIADHDLPESYKAEKIYYGVTHSTVEDTEAAIIEALNRGQLMVNYMGHASVEWWATEKLFERDDYVLLFNEDRLPFFSPMTCLEGYYINPPLLGGDPGSLGETVVRELGRGAVASWSPTGLGVATGHDVLQKGLFQAIFQDGVIQIGPATTQAKLYLYANAAMYDELIETYVLFGDPATKLQVILPEPSTATPTATTDPSITPPSPTPTATPTSTPTPPSEKQMIYLPLLQAGEYNPKDR